MTDDGLCEVILTAPDEAWLTAFASQLVSDHLVAAAHIIPGIRALYRWEGVQHNETEARAALHTRTALVPRILARINREHPYVVPGVVVVPLTGGLPSYLGWIKDETAATRGPAQSSLRSTGS